VKQWNSIDEVLTHAIGEEQAAADFYTRLADNAKVPGMKQTFYGFAQEEMGHKARLEAIKAGGKFRPIPRQIADLKIADYLVDIAPDPHLDYRSALVVAMKKEKAAFKLYSDLAASTADETIRAVFRGLAQEEANHKLRFEIEYDDLLTEG